MTCNFQAIEPVRAVIIIWKILPEWSSMNKGAAQRCIYLHIFPNND